MLTLRNFTILFALVFLAGCVPGSNPLPVVGVQQVEAASTPATAEVVLVETNTPFQPAPTTEPTSVPTTIPTATQTALPTSEPTSVPTTIPTATQTALPTVVIYMTTAEDLHLLSFRTVYWLWTGKGDKSWSDSEEWGMFCTVFNVHLPAMDKGVTFGKLFAEHEKFPGFALEMFEKCSPDISPNFSDWDLQIQVFYSGGS